MLLKQVRVATSQNKLVLFNSIDQKPIRFNMAFSKTDIIPDQSVVTISLGKQFVIL